MTLSTGIPPTSGHKALGTDPLSHFIMRQFQPRAFPVGGKREISLTGIVALPTPEAPACRGPTGPNGSSEYGTKRGLGGQSQADPQMS
jgi:hypothetical protein